MTLTPLVPPSLPAPSITADGVQVGWLLAGVRDLLSSDTVDDEASRHLYESLGEVPVQVAAAVGCGLRREEIAQATGAAALAGVLQGLLRKHIRTTGSARFAQVQRVLELLGRSDDAAELTAGCAASACAAGGYDRALLSRVEGSSWSPGVVHESDSGPYRGVAGVAEDLPLAAGRPETEAVRRRVPVLAGATGGHDEHPLTGAGTHTPYVVAPVVVEGRVIGLLHADKALTGRPLTRLDRDVLQLFVDGFARAYERVALLERLARQREHVRATLAPYATPGDADPALVRLTRACTPVPELRSAHVLASAAENSQTGRLTAREHEILRLLATGATNMVIAERLFLSESTVKSHVKRILRKLPAANRAEAVYVYLRTAGTQDRSA
jgi:DNA-binding CsgD family transcriptional regulator